MKIGLSHTVLLWFAVSTTAGFLKITHQFEKLTGILLVLSLLLSIVVVYKLFRRITTT
ncbi:MAG: hypothetical protein QM726_03780 [Chitinophagaceae bacterium]